MTAPTSVQGAVRRELRLLGRVDGELARSPLAMAMLVLAKRLDDRETPAAATAAVARELREGLEVLRARVPKSGADTLDEIAATRAKRRLEAAG